MAMKERFGRLKATSKGAAKRTQAKAVDPAVAAFLSETWTKEEIRQAAKAIKRSTGRDLKVL
jgi:hypothetical protein